MRAADWSVLPEPLLLAILQQLEVADILNASRTCVHWSAIARDDYLWRRLFRRDFRVGLHIELRPGAHSWYSEYKRMLYELPHVLTEDVKDAHAHQVLHVSCSHNGRMFATCSKDGRLIVWSTAHPVSVIYTHDMKEYNWKHTQYSEFNASDTLILVSGVYKGDQLTTSGEIAVFTVVGDKSEIRCRVVNRPFDIFGTWFSDRRLLSGDLNWLAHLVSTTVLWLNRANDAANAELVPEMRQIYQFRNRNASSIRALLVADAKWMMAADNPEMHEDVAKDKNDHDIDDSSEDDEPQFDRMLDNLQDYDIRQSAKFRRDFGVAQSEGPLESSASGEPSNGSDDERVEMDDLKLRCPKYLIFLTGFSTYSPHQIGFKFIDNTKSVESLLRERQERNNPDDDAPHRNAAANNLRYDRPDKIIDLHGQIIGMALSPDHRYLYVNSRSWPANYVIANVLEPPPIAQEVDMHVIDMRTLEPVGNLLSSHRAFTSNTECFFLFPQVSDTYVTSGAEDLHAYVWDRYYGICVSKYPHGDVVNSATFIAGDEQMLVTVSDDYTIKVWRSLRRCTELGATQIKRAVRTFGQALKQR